ncbi:DUF916 and DUF3324 domain-containing protein [Candidatus Enterococcus mansonii]|uniref:DUF3324 domain-containing protein n=2 Tax=Candidatus Enterococcus mansonii TaxID=1834181 RepID=A0ABU8IIR8_9ENTE
MKRILTLLVTIITLGSMPLSALADDGSMNFSVNAVLPENQIDKSKSYFELLMKPGQVQELEVMLNNPFDKEVTVVGYANTAITNDNGIVDYSINKPKLDSTLKAPFSEITEMEKETIVPPKSSKKVKIKVTMPKEKFDGVILGGLHFTEKEDENKENKKKAGVQIENRFAFAIGVLLKETDTDVNPDMKLGKIAASQINYRNVVKANLQNTEPVIMHDLNVKARVTQKGKKATLFETNKDSMRMAPNSNFDYSIYWENKEFKAGKYTLHMTATNASHKWKWSKDFEITGEEAKKLNEQAVELKKDYTKWYILGAVAGVLLLLIITYALGQYMNRRKQKKRKKKKKNNKRKK